MKLEYNFYGYTLVLHSQTAFSSFAFGREDKGIYTYSTHTYIQYTHTRTHTHTHTHMHIHTSVHTHTQTHTHQYTHTLTKARVVSTKIRMTYTMFCVRHNTNALYKFCNTFQKNAAVVVSLETTL